MKAPLDKSTPAVLPATSPKRVLILSASAGAGHVRAADALLKEFQQREGVAQVEHWDMLKYTTKVFEAVYSKLYLELVNKAPKMLGWIYDRTDTPWKNDATRLIEKFNSRPFIKAVTAYQPDMIVCTHFTPANIVGGLFLKGKLPQKPAIVVTDFDCHALWLTEPYEHYFVALAETGVFLEKMGIAANRITVSGIPIDPVFREIRDVAATRRTLGLHPNKFTILVSAGGYGVGPVERLIGEILQLQHTAQVVAIAGRSEDLKAQLDALAKNSDPKSNVRLFPIGFTKEMDKYMAAADILIGKPGGLTTSEAMARHLPMCIVNPIPGQEERNSDHLLEEGVAIRCNTLETIAFKLDHLIAHPERLREMRANTRKLGRPQAAQTIANTMLSQSLANQTLQLNTRH